MRNNWGNYREFQCKEGPERKRDMSMGWLTGFQGNEDGDNRTDKDQRKIELTTSLPGKIDHHLMISFFFFGQFTCLHVGFSLGSVGNFAFNAQSFCGLRLTRHACFLLLSLSEYDNVHNSWISISDSSLPKAIRVVYHFNYIGFLKWFCAFGCFAGESLFKNCIDINNMNLRPWEASVYINAFKIGSVIK